MGAESSRFQLSKAEGVVDTQENLQVMEAIDSSRKFCQKTDQIVQHRGLPKAQQRRLQDVGLRVRQHHGHHRQNSQKLSHRKAADP
jgi:hypothetical protein